MYLATKKIYTDSDRKLYQQYITTQSNSVSFLVFYNFKPFYCVRPSQKEKQSCLCINCLNPRVKLKAINGYHLSQKLSPHNSFTTYIKQLNRGEQLDEMEAGKMCKYNEYDRIKESYLGKEGEPTEYTRTACVDHCEPVLVNKLLDVSDKYLKHRTYVDNCTSVFPLMKKRYSQKFIELDFPKNLSLTPKDNVSDDRNHNGIFVDHVIRDIIQKYDINNEDLWKVTLLLI